MTLLDEARRIAEESAAERAATTPGPWAQVPGFPYKNSPDALWITHEHERPMAETILALVAEVERLAASDAASLT